MSNRINHAKLTAKLRQKEPAWPTGSKWQSAARVEIAPYRGRDMRPCEVLMDNPGFFFWAVENGASNREVWCEAQQLAYKVRGLLAPRRDPRQWCFARLIVDGILTDIRLIRTSNGAPPGYQLSRRLDLSWASNSGVASTAAGRTVLMQKVTKWFFQGKTPSKWSIRVFFDGSSNFGPAGR